MCRTHHSDSENRWKPSQNGELAGTSNMFQKDMELLNNSETVMISVCLRGARI